MSKQIIKIAIDFGSTNSAIAAAKYLVEDDGTRKMMDSFPVLGYQNQHQYTIPTMIAYTEDNSEQFSYDLYGSLASQAYSSGYNTTVRAEFKKILFDPENSEFENAKKYTKDYLAFLKTTLDSYLQDERNKDLEKEIHISVPVRSDGANKDLMKKLVSEAGFGLVEKIYIEDEAECALRYVLNQELFPLKKELEKSTIHDYKLVLMVDIGGSTTDIMLLKCSVTEEHTLKYENLSIGSSVGEKNTFGGTFVDKALKEYLLEKECLLPELVEEKEKHSGLISFEKFKKEINVRLKNGQVIEHLGDLEQLAWKSRREFSPVDYSDPANEDVKITHEKYIHTICKDYINGLISAIRYALRNTSEEYQIDESMIDFVVVTGGGSKLYFIEKMLLGEISGDTEEALDLEKVKKEPFRLLIPSEEHARCQAEKILQDPSLMCVLGNIYEAPHLQFVNSSNAEYWVRIHVYSDKAGNFEAFQNACKGGELPKKNETWTGKRLASFSMMLSKNREPLPANASLEMEHKVKYNTANSIYMIVQFQRKNDEGQKIVFKTWYVNKIRTLGNYMVTKTRKFLDNAFHLFESDYYSDGSVDMDTTMKTICNSKIDERGKITLSVKTNMVGINGWDSGLDASMG